MSTVFIARGHGDKPSGTHDPGAVSGDWTEQKAADVVAPVVASDLERAGVNALDEGEDDPNFYGSVKQANRAGVDLFVALHWDWSGGLAIHAFHYSTSDEGEEAARSITNALGNAGFILESPTVRERDGLYVLRETTMPATLVELGRIGEFGSDPTEHLKNLGHAIAQGILDYLGVEAPRPEPEPEKENNWTEDIVDNLPLLKKRNDLHRASDHDRRAQGLLAAAGVLEIEPNLDGRRFDGKFGPSTDRAVREFQRRNGLQVDGYIGPNTWTALLGG